MAKVEPQKEIIIKSAPHKSEFRPFDSVEESITEGSINNSFEDPSIF